jgi:hypothetical protein
MIAVLAWEMQVAPVALLATPEILEELLVVRADVIAEQKREEALAKARRR